MIGTNVKILIQLERICWCLGEHPPNEFKKILETLYLIAFPPPPPPPPPPRTPPKVQGIDLSGTPIPQPAQFKTVSCPSCSLRNAVLTNRLNHSVDKFGNKVIWISCQGCHTQIYV